MLTKDGVEFKPGMTLYLVEDEPELIFHREETHRTEALMNEYWFPDYVANRYASREAAVAVALPLFEEHLAWVQGEIARMKNENHTV